MFSFLPLTYSCTLLSGSLKTASDVSPAPLYASWIAWKYASSLSQPEQPHVRRTSTGPLDVNSARSISLPVASLILNAGASDPMSTLPGGSAARGASGRAATRMAIESRRVTRHLEKGDGVGCEGSLA